MPDQAFDPTNTLSDRYSIERALGAGGMATVYLGHDLRHHRPVAIKVLHPHLAAVLGSDRFLQEIRVTANLQHPHILPLFDSGATDASLFYVMPFVDGGSLRERLRHERQLQVDEVIRVATELAGALDYAHRQGLIHRDIKPENVLFHQGRALLADFGIALAIQTAGGSRLTESGLALGTPQYMSPEQAVGERQLDARTDIYSLGCVCYEMLVGEPPHQGPTMQAVVARIMTETPRALTATRPTLPTPVAAAVHRALHRVPADRYATAGDFAAALTSPTVDRIGFEKMVGADSPPPDGYRFSMPSMLAAAVTLMALGGLLGRFLARESGPAVQRTELFATDSVAEVDPQYKLPLRISRDGRSIVFVGHGTNGTQLFVRSLSERGVRPIPGTEAASTPAISPDGDSVAFIAQGAIRKVSLRGGAPISVQTGLPAPDLITGLDWGVPGRLIYAFGYPASRIFSTSTAGGAPEPWAAGDSRSCLTPILLPDDRGAIASCADSLVVIQSGKDSLVSLGPGWAPRFAAGKLLFISPSDRTLFAQQFDPRARRLSGQPIPISGDVTMKGTTNGEYDISESGTLVHSSRPSKSRVAVVDRNGIASEISVVSAWPRLSPDGGRVLSLMDDNAQWSVYVSSVATGTTQRLNFEGHPMDFSWSPDGRWLVYSNNIAGDYDLWLSRSDGSDRPRLLLRRPLEQMQPSFTRDGKWIVFTERDSRSDGDVAVMSTADTSHVELLVKTPFRDIEPTVSADGRWLAYVSDETGRPEVYVKPFRREGGAELISVEGGDQPVWSVKGLNLYYRHGSQVMVASMAPGEAFRVEQRQTLFDRPEDEGTVGSRFFDVSADGNTFVFTTSRGRRIVVTQGALNPKP